MEGLKGFDLFFLAVADGFTSEINMTLTKAAGIACSVADIVFIAILLKTTQTLRSEDSLKPAKRLFVLRVFALLTPTLALPIDRDFFLIWQSFVLGIPYLILAYSVIAEFPVLLRHVRARVSSHVRPETARM